MGIINKILSIIGDININMLVHNTNSTNTRRNIINSYHLSLINWEATRITLNSVSRIDVILANTDLSQHILSKLDQILF